MDHSSKLYDTCVHNDTITVSNTINEKYAYVTVLYGNNIYLAGTLVLGFSLMETASKYDRVILVTPDVQQEYRIYLKKFYTHIIEVDYIDANPSIFLEEDTRFTKVFTKLQCLGLVQYQKIIVLDSDMIILKNIDHLFSLETPAACLRIYEHPYDHPYGMKIPLEKMCTDGKLFGGINAGLMLLEPNLMEWDEIQKEIRANPNSLKVKYPEQDYLSLRYSDKWTSITFNYNYQFGFTDRVKNLNYQNLYVIHYSSSYCKPWNVLIPFHQPTETEENFKNEHLKFYELWEEFYGFVKKKFADDGVVLPY